MNLEFPETAFLAGAWLHLHGGGSVKQYFRHVAHFPRPMRKTQSVDNEGTSNPSPITGAKRAPSTLPNPSRMENVVALTGRSRQPAFPTFATHSWKVRLSIPTFRWQVNNWLAQQITPRYSCYGGFPSVSPPCISFGSRGLGISITLHGSLLLGWGICS